MSAEREVLEADVIGDEEECGILSAIPIPSTRAMRTSTRP